jgi:hypothetical protein
MMLLSLLPLGSGWGDQVLLLTVKGAAVGVRAIIHLLLLIGSVEKIDL